VPQGCDPALALLREFSLLAAGVAADIKAAVAVLETS
jgi:hypothetical protein